MYYSTIKLLKAVIAHEVSDSAPPGVLWCEEYSSSTQYLLEYINMTGLNFGCASLHLSWLAGQRHHGILQSTVVSWSFHTTCWGGDKLLAYNLNGDCCHRPLWNVHECHFVVTLQVESMVVSTEIFVVITCLGKLTLLSLLPMCLSSEGRLVFENKKIWQLLSAGVSHCGLTSTWEGKSEVMLRDVCCAK